MKISPMRPSSYSPVREIDLVAADDRLLGVALAPARHLFAPALDELFDDALGSNRGTLVGGLGGGQFGGALFRFVLIFGVGQDLAVERLREFGAVAIERVGFQRLAPGAHVGGLAVLDARLVRHVDRLRDRAGDERLAGRHHVDVGVDREVAAAFATARVGAVEDGQVLVFQVWCALEGHGAANVLVGRLDVGLREAEMGEQVELGIVEFFGRHAKRLGEEGIAERPAVKDELDVEGGSERAFDRAQGFVGEALGAQGGVVDRRCCVSEPWPTA